VNPSIPPQQISLITPAPPASRAGNRNTALRWARLLRELGHNVRIGIEWTAPAGGSRTRATPLLLALHARRSHASIARFRAAFPGRPIVLALTGTDIYRDIRDDADAQRSLELADRLIVLQACALDELSPRLRAKAHVVLQSAPAVKPIAPLARCFELCGIGHLRWEKDPLCAARALAELPPAGAGSDPALAALRISHAGRALEVELERGARAAMAADTRYRWLGELAPARARRLIARSRAMIISSRLEGGANVVSEAIAAGTPVLASHIPGNVGLLGADWPAYYPVEDHRALAALIRRVATEPAFLQTLRTAIGRLAWLADPAQERSALASVVAAALAADGSR
jgi:putative glycosyltransferase (TIGR04348 family)